MASGGSPALRGEEIVWNSRESRFETKDGMAYLQYRLRSVGRKEGEKRRAMDVIHTYVPPSKRGLGIAAHLCHAALSHANENGLLIIPTCSYVSETFLPRNPAWQELVFQESIDAV